MPRSVFTPNSKLPADLYSEMQARRLSVMSKFLRSTAAGWILAAGLAAVLPAMAQVQMQTGTGSAAQPGATTSNVPSVGSSVQSLSSGVKAAGEVLDITDSLAHAYSGNPTLGAARAANRAVDEGVPAAKSGWRPTVNIIGSTGAQSVYYDANTVSRQDTYTNPTSAQLQVTQPLYKFGTNPAIDSAEALVLAQRSTTASTEQQILLQAATAHLAVVRDQAVLELNRNNAQVLRKQLEATQDRFRVGEVTRTDVAQAEAALAGATAQVEASEGNLISSRANFVKVVGVQPGRLTRTNVPGELPSSEQQLWTIAQDENPDILAARYREASSKFDIAAVAGGVISQPSSPTVGGLLPTVVAQGSLVRGIETQQPNVNQKTAQVTVQLNIPLYESGVYHSFVRQRKQVNSQRKQQIDESYRTVRASTTQAWEALLTARANIRSFTEQVRANRIALESIQQEANVGSRTVLDVLITEQNLLTSEVSLVRAEYEERVAAYTVKSVMGRLTGPQLKLPVEYYDPTENYRRVRDKWFGTDGGIR